jgi:hypothetical protein
MPVRFRPPVPVRVGVAQLDESAGFRSPRPLVRFQPLTPDLKFRGLGKRINPLGLGPRESRFKSEVPDQFLWGSQVVRQLAVNQLMRRFESCPHSQKRRGRLLVEGPSPTKRCSRVRSSTPVPDKTTRLWPSGFRHRSSFSYGPQRNTHPVRQSDTCWFESSQAFHAEVVQWKDEGL